MNSFIMENLNKKSWHSELAQATKLKPNLVPSDIFFQFKKNQPYKFNRNSELKIKNFVKPPITHTHMSREFAIPSLRKIKSRPSSQLSGHRLTEDSNVSRSSLNTSKIEKTSEKLLHEIGLILDKENRRNSTPSIQEKSEAFGEYKDVSKRISLINRGRVPLRIIKADMYKKFY
jgi:hypothetical protein